MTPYLAIVSARARVLLQYRAAALAGVLTQCFWGLIKIMILGAFYAGATVPPPLPAPAMESYVWLGQAAFVLLPWSFDPEIRPLLRTGGIGYELARPLDLYWLWFARNTAHRVVPATLRFVPVLAVGSLWSGWILPPDPAALAAWAAATLGAVLLGSALLNLVASSMLWTIAGEGAGALNGALIFVFSGMIVPLPLLPDGFRELVALLPYAGLVDHPVRLWSGDLAPAALPAVLAHQAAWILVLVVAGRFAMARGLARIEVQGG